MQHFIHLFLQCYHAFLFPSYDQSHEPEMGGSRIFGLVTIKINRFVNFELRQEHQCVTCIQHQLHYTRVLPRLVTNAVLLRCMQPPMAWRLPPQKYPGVDGVPNIIWQFVHCLLERKYPLIFPIHCWIQFFDSVVTSIQVSSVQCYI